MITIITEPCITADGVAITLGMKVWLDAYIAGVAWAEVSSIDDFGVQISFGGKTFWDVFPHELYASEANALAAYETKGVLRK